MSTNGQNAVPKMDDLIAFNQQLMTLIDAGIPVELGDGTPSDTVPERLSQIASQIALQVGLGQSVEQAMLGDTNVPSAYRAAWETWFHGNRPIEALNSLANQAESRREMQLNVGNSLIPPLIVLGLVYFGFIYLVLFASRQLEATYQQLGEPPSVSLSVLILARQWLPVWGSLIPVALIVCLAFWWRKSGKWSYGWLPGRKRYVASIGKANYADNIAKLLEQNHSLAESLHLVGPFEAKSEVPSMLRWAFAANVEDSSRVNLLRFAARTYRDSARIEVKRWRNWLPVIASVLIGGSIVLAYSLSLFAPIIGVAQDIDEALRKTTMPNYSYEAIGSDGEVVSGEITADRVSDAISQLEAQGLQVESIRAIVAVPDSSLDRKAFYDRIDKALEGRESLIPALDALADEVTHRDAARDIRRFACELKSGATAEQFVKCESTAPWIPLIVRGLESGTTADRYGQLMDDAARESENRKNLRAVLAYPLFLLVFALVLLMVLAVLVVPRFAKMFSEFGLQLPAPTRLVFWISKQLTENSLGSLVTVAFVFVVIVGLGRLWFRFALSTSLLGLFTSGNSANLTAMAKFTGSLAELVSIEAPLPEALRIAGRACEHRHFRVMSERMASELEETGVTIRATSVSHNFPATVRYALGSGRNTSASVPLLRALSRMYSDRARIRSNWSTSILGPISLIVLGLIVGFVLIALFMPLVSLITALA